MRRLASPRLLSAAFVVALVALPAAAGPRTVTVDWAAGMVTAEGVGLANRHAPNPEVARGTSRRAAEAAARKQLAAKLRALPVATGGTVADQAKDKAVATRLERAVANALAVTAEPETDGAWRVTLGVPVEAVRQALAGPRVLAEGAADGGPSVVVVEGAAGAKPAVGWTVGGVAAPTVWVAANAIPAWAKDAPRVMAKSAKAGVIVVEGTDASAATLFVIITGK